MVRDAAVFCFLNENFWKFLKPHVGFIISSESRPWLRNLSKRTHYERQELWDNRITHWRKLNYALHHRIIQKSNLDAISRQKFTAQSSGHATPILLNRYWQILENSFKNFPEISVFRGVIFQFSGHELDRFLENSSVIFCEYLFSFCKISGHELDRFLENPSIFGKSIHFISFNNQISMQYLDKNLQPNLLDMRPPSCLILIWTRSWRS